MINPHLHTRPVALDVQQHRHLKVSLPVTDWSVAKRLNAIFVAATEFSDACKEYPIVFVRAGKEADGRDEIAPVAVLGVLAEQNLYLDGPAQSQWRAAYRPAVLQAYPFCIGRVDDKTFAICVDMAWPGVGADSADSADGPDGPDGRQGGQPIFDSAGQPAELLKGVRQHMELLEREIQNTRAFGRRLLELDLLRDMRFDATLPDGRKHTVDGFLTVDAEKAQKLDDKVVGELHRSGMLGLIQLHWTSLALMRRLMDWHVQRHPAPAANAPAVSGQAAAGSAGAA